MSWNDQETVSIVDWSAPADFGKSLTGRSFGDYSLGERIGEGGNGFVYRARQQTLERDVVIKVLRRRAETSGESQLAARFLREAQLASGLDHPYAAHIYDFGVEFDGVMWIAMELVNGAPLKTIIHSQGALPLARLVPLLEKICEVVHTAHGHGIIHRDLKPSNIMVLSRAGQLLPKLLDFGIARRSGASIPVDPPPPSTAEPAPPIAISPASLLASISSGKTTPVGASLGTPMYMAPEQWRDAAHADERADLYSLGVVAYEALTGRLPFSSSSVRKLAKAHANTPMPSLGPEFSTELNAVLRRAMAKNPADRYPDALAFARAMRALVPQENPSQSLLTLDQSQVQRYLERAPQPLADAVASLDVATDERLATRALQQLVRVSFGLLGVIALGAAARTGMTLDDGDDVDDVDDVDDGDPHSTLQSIRHIRRGYLDPRSWLDIATGLVRPFVDHPDAHLVPELVLLLAPTGGDPEQTARLRQIASYGAQDGLARAAQMSDIRSVTADVSWLLQRLGFLCDYPLVVASQDRVESWAGARRAVHPLFVLQGGYTPADGEILLTGANREPVLIMSPLMQRLEPAPLRPPELFLLAGGDPYGTLLTAFPTGFDRHVQNIWPWLGDRFPALASEQTAQIGGEPDEEAPPYMGLAPFSRADADRFFGREDEVEECVNRLRVSSLLAVVGPSGAGKSSFVQAGILPALPDTWRVISTRPGAKPIEALAACLQQLNLAEPVSEAQMRADPDALRTALRTWVSAPGEMVVLVVDQFEELVTLCAEPGCRQRFAEILMRAAHHPDDSIRVVITLRDDFLLRVQQIGPLSDHLGHSLQLLATPPAEQLQRILVGPAERAGYRFDDPTLPEAMVDAVAAEPSALALLSFTAAKLWERRDRQFRRLQRRVYEELGGVGGALAQHAESILSAMTDDQHDLVREVFRQLVTADGTRAILTRLELFEILGGSARAEPVLEALIRARLLTAAEGRAAADAHEPAHIHGPRVDHIEVVHEALLSSWPRLVEWQREDAENARLRDQLRAAARQWRERECPTGLLWRADALLEYRVWRSRYPGALTQIEEQFASASVSADERGRRLRRTLLALLIIGLTLVVVVVVGLNRDISAQRDRTAQFARAATENARLAQRNLLELQREQGRQALAANEPMQAFVYLRTALAGQPNSGQPNSDQPNSDQPNSDQPNSSDTGQNGQRSATRFMLARAVDALADQHLVLRAHEGNVMDALFNRDGTLLATGGTDSKARIWDVQTGALVHTLIGHEEQVWAMDFQPDGDRLVTASWDGTGIVWDAQTGTRLWTAEHEKGLSDAVFSADGEVLVTASSDRSAKVWRTRDGLLLQTLDGHPAVLWSVAVDASGQHVVTGSHDHIARVWSTATGGLLAATKSHGQPVSRVALSTDGQLVATSSFGGLARVFSVRGPAQGARVLTLEADPNGLNGARFSPDGRQLLTAGNSSIKIWDSATGTLLKTLNGHAGGTARILFAPDGQRFFSLGFDGTARAWSARTGVLEWTYIGHRDALWNGDVSPDSSLLATASFDGTVRIWDARKTRHLASWSEPTAPARDSTQAQPVAAQPSAPVVVQHALMAPSEQRVAASYSDGTVRIWTREGTLLHTLAMESWSEVPHGARLSWHPDGTRLLGSGGVAAQEWDVETGRLGRVFQDHGTWVAHAVYSPDGAYVATAGQDGTVKLHVDLPSRSSNRPPTTLSGNPAPIRFVGFSPDSQRLVSVGDDRVVRFWQVPGGQLEPIEIATRQVIYSVRFSPDGTRVVIASQDQTAEIRSAADGELLVALEGHATDIRQALFSRDGHMVVTASEDKTIKVWDARDGTILWSLTQGQIGRPTIEFTPDGRQLLGAFGPQVHLWPLGSDERSDAQLDAYAACRIDYTLSHSRIRRITLDYQACQPGLTQNR